MMLSPPATVTSMPAMLLAPPSEENRCIQLRTITKTKKRAVAIRTQRGPLKTEGFSGNIFLLFIFMTSPRELNQVFLIGYCFQRA